ncbi:MOSC domain-containing protein [Paenibacillus gallinarum]|uniref:MOSC domain-containing protein n=1 Tax=Paenibacillus gallinarum TaxID=2762232 RepID=A0ABR8T4P2_9BACL|nr:MOSC domain-containing protein [Paenibacillus gallinarum]MBD7970730.1 MOSC domain-containing protein [Paenibacillus gallinarum]
MYVGRIKEIVRHPIKSFQGERVPRTQVMEYGLYGDRSHAFVHKSNKNQYVTITQLPQMASFQANFTDQEDREHYPRVEVVTPLGQKYYFGDEELNRTLEELYKKEIVPIQFQPAHVPLGAIEEEPIQLVTDASITQLEKIWGNNEVDSRRFRPNFVLSLVDQVPFMEEQWLGKRMQIGENVILLIKRPCKRCSIINIHPENAKRDPSLLKKIVTERNNQFGIYASVLHTGIVSEGDEVTLLD